MTFGGPILKDKLWFFGAGRLQTNSTNNTTPYTGFNYTKVVDDKRGEGKLTYAINPKQHGEVVLPAQGSLDTTNDSFSTIMDQASLYNDTVAESLLAANYQAVLTSNLFIEGAVLHPQDGHRPASARATWTSSRARPSGTGRAARPASTRRPTAPSAPTPSTS